MKLIPLVWGTLTDPCSWAPEGLAMPVSASVIVLERDVAPW